MKFLADMGVSLRCVEWLRENGHNAKHLCEEKFHQMLDDEVLAKARKEDRILLTMDLDFTRLVITIGSENIPNVILFRLHDNRPQSINNIMQKIIPTIDECASKGSFIMSVSENNVRVRYLPIF